MRYDERSNLAVELFMYIYKSFCKLIQGEDAIKAKGNLNYPLIKDYASTLFQLWANSKHAEEIIGEDLLRLNLHPEFLNGFLRMLGNSGKTITKESFL